MDLHDASDDRLNTPPDHDDNAQVQCRRHGDVAVVTISNPPINAGSLAVRHGLLTAIRSLNADDAVQAAVLIGAGSTFMAGSDLKEFGKPLESPDLPAVIAAIEACRKPVVAAIHGAALGGGFELALGCDARIASPSALVGLPEVTLGIIPGAGGTQRLPRLVGPAKALELILSGRRVPADQALSLGMIDRIAEMDLEADAVRYARELIGRKRNLLNEAVPGESPEAIDHIASAALKKRGGDRPAAREAIRMIREGLSLAPDEALREERAAFQTLRLSEDAFALRHVFFAERAAARTAKQPSVKLRPVERVAVVGAGTMGAGIAVAALDGGYGVILADTSADALDRGMARVTDTIRGRAAKGRIPADAADGILGRLQGRTDLAALSSADLIIEAVFEDLDVKAQVFRSLDRIARPDAILATNTSYLSVTAIAGQTANPDRVVGLHFFSPANVMRLVEVVRTPRIAPDVLATAFSFSKSLGKQPILSADSFGFIGNRIYAAYRRQCEFMLEEGALPAQIDGALEAFGFAMGPFAVADLSGLDIAWRMRQATASSRDPTARYVDIPDILCQQGRLGRKAGKGYYRYDDKGRPVTDPDVTALVLAESDRKGLSRRAFDDADIVRRVLTAMACEAAHLLTEAVPERPEDIDLVLLNGYGFPKWKGGPVFQARRRGIDALSADFRDLAARSGPGFPMADPRVLFPNGAACLPDGR